MNMKMLNGLYNAPKDKRYKSFVTRAADTEEVWILLENSTADVFRQENVFIWPGKEFIEMYAPTALSRKMEVHDFIDGCQERMASEDFIIHVFANNTDSYDVYASQLIQDMQEELDLVE